MVLNSSHKPGYSIRLVTDFQLHLARYLMPRLMILRNHHLWSDLGVDALR